ncbi:MAG: DNA-binding domain-containing protein [Pseudomonadota bacterium]
MQWHDLQSQFIGSLRNPDRGLPDGLGAVSGSLQTKRFNVYRNNVAVSLAENLAASYPVTQQLVGEEFFTGMARVFVDRNAPTSPVMLGYGEDFPDFISRFEPAQGLPFLADVARIERSWNGAYNASDADPIGIEVLQSIAPDALESTIIHLHPSLQIIRSDWPALSIWHLHQTAVDPAAEMQNLSPEAQSGLIVRPGLDVDVRLIPDLAAVFYTALAQGRSLGMAAELLADAQSDDMGAMLQLLFSCGAVSAVEPPVVGQP